MVALWVLVVLGYLLLYAFAWQIRGGQVFVTDRISN